MTTNPPKNTNIQTVSGRLFDPHHPDPAQVDIEDIAHALSHICRYNGHTRFFYSVAEHSVIISELVSSEAALHALLHDAAEAYVGDIVRPLKTDRDKDIEARVLRTIYRALELALPSAEVEEEVAEYDLKMLATERPVLLPGGPEWPTLNGVKGFPAWHIKGLNSFKSRWGFLNRFWNLTEGRQK